MGISDIFRRDGSQQPAASSGLWVVRSSHVQEKGSMQRRVPNVMLLPLMSYSATRRIRCLAPSRGAPHLHQHVDPIVPAIRSVLKPPSRRASISLSAVSCRPGAGRRDRSLKLLQRPETPSSLTLFLPRECISASGCWRGVNNTFVRGFMASS